MCATLPGVRRSPWLAATLTLLALGCASRRPPESVRALPTAPSAQPALQAAAEGAPLSAEQLDQLVAPVALYPDALLALVLPASTQPIQIVEAARFLDARDSDPQLAPPERWDEPVRALLNYPEVVALMNGDLAWTQALGDAVASRQSDVMDAIQQVRTRALAAGNLKTNAQYVVTQEEGVIRIESADPNVIYVPIYDPTVIYVASPTTIVTYYPPYPCYWCPNAAFGMGMMMGFNWYYYDIYYDHHHHHDDDIDIDIDHDRPDRPDRPNRPERPDQVWKPNRPGSGQGAANRPAARPSTLPSQPGIGGSRPAPGGPAGPIGMDRLTKLPAESKRPSAGSRPGDATPTTRDAYGGYERGRDAMRESNRGAQSRGAGASYGDRSTRGSSWGGYGNSANAWSSRGAASRSSMPRGGYGGGGYGRGGGFGGGGGRGGGGRGR